MMNFFPKKSHIQFQILDFLSGNFLQQEYLHTTNYRHHWFASVPGNAKVVNKQRTRVHFGLQCYFEAKFRRAKTNLGGG